MKASNTRVLIVDSHPIIRDGLANLLAPSLKCAAFTGCGAFADARRQLERGPIDLIVSDFRILGDTVLTFLEELRNSSSKARCLIYSGGDEVQVGYPCMRAGAAGFVSKAEPVERVVTAAKTVLDGRQYISASLSKLLMGPQGRDQPSAGTHLSHRELEVFSMLGTGLRVSQIASRLGISVKTVETHRENIKNKLGFDSASQVIAAAARWLDETTVAI